MHGREWAVLLTVMPVAGNVVPPFSILLVKKKMSVAQAWHLERQDYSKILHLFYSVSLPFYIYAILKAALLRS